jgi:MOSC domain-containing protein YiiM
MLHGSVTALSRSDSHSFSKHLQPTIHLRAGLGVDDDAHQGATVRHRSRVARDPSQPNLRQVHLIHGELFDELQEQGFTVTAGQLGENITTRGLALLSLPRGTLLHVGSSAVLEVTGLRNPCSQIEAFQPGLLAAVVTTAPDGSVHRKTGIMAIVLVDGTVAAGDDIRVVLPPPPHTALAVV